MQLHFEKLGTGPPLIVLHGLFGSLDNWQTLNRRFAAHFQVFAVDQRNHGRSPHAPEMSYPLMAEDIRELLDAQGLERADVLGHSMGGKTAMLLALTHPERVRKLVVVDIAPKAYPAKHRRMLDALLSLNLASFQNRQQIEAALAQEIPDLDVRRFLLKGLARDDRGQFFWRMGLREINDNYSQLLESVSGDRAFAGPALFLRGRDSDYVCEEDAALSARIFPQFTMRTIAGAGHWLHAEAPEAVAEAVLNFLR